MKRVALVVLIMTGATLVMTGCLEGEKQAVPTKMDSLGWWPTKAAPEPKPDPREGMAGEWWWAADRAAEQDALWGNRGFVYVLRRTGKEPVTGEKKVEKLPRGLKKVEALVFEDVNFDFDNSEILPVGQKILDEVVKTLQGHSGATVALEGHTCSIGEADYNLRLGKRRAEAVRKYLVDHGISPERLTVVSYGETRLKYTNRETGLETSRRDYERNRRVEFKVSMPEEIK